MRVVVPPALVDGRICRIVAPLESLLEVEEWTGAWWAPSSVPLTLVSQAERASEDVLRSHDVPPSDRSDPATHVSPTEMEALIHTDAPIRPEGMRFDEEQVARATPARPRVYPGNARFRRATPMTSTPVPPVESGDMPRDTAPPPRTRRAGRDDPKS